MAADNVQTFTDGNFDDSVLKSASPVLVDFWAEWCGPFKRLGPTVDALTTEVENFPGYRDGIMGPDLMAEMRAQSERFGTEIIQGNVASVDLCATPIVVKTTEVEYLTKTLILATGASARLLGLPSERTLMGHGVSTCATCDGYFFRGQEIAVVGGGDSAMEEALFLTKFATKVTIVHRRETLRASKIMQEKARANPKIAWALDTEVDEIRDTGKGAVSGMVVRHNKT